MRQIAVRLREWREAELRRGSLPPGSRAWHAADEAVHDARVAYQAEARRATVYYAELELADHDRSFASWLGRIDRQMLIDV